MRTLLIEQGGVAPDELRRIVQRGSTELVRSPGPADHDVDRVVIWDANGSERSCTPQGARDWPESAEVFVIAPDTRGVPAPEATNLFAWPADADRLRMAFMTGG